MHFQGSILIRRQYAIKEIFYRNSTFEEILEKFDKVDFFVFSQVKEHEVHSLLLKL